MVSRGGMKLQSYKNPPTTDSIDFNTIVALESYQHEGAVALWSSTIMLIPQQEMNIIKQQRTKIFVS